MSRKEKRRAVRLTCVSLLAVLAVSGTTEAAIRVAVEDGTGRGGGAAAVAQLNDDTFFDFDATLVNASMIDTIRSA